MNMAANVTFNFDLLSTMVQRPDGAPIRVDRDRAGLNGFRLGLSAAFAAGTAP